MRILERIFGGAANAPSQDAVSIDALIHRLVGATDKRLAVVKETQTRLREPVALAWRELRGKIAHIPGPTAVSAQCWGADDTLRCLFAGRDDAAAAYSEDADVRDFFALHPAGDCFGMLALQQVERRVIAPALHGDMVQTEVARTTVSFADPQVLAPGMDEESVRDELVKRALEYLGLRALQRVGTLRAQRHGLQQERALLQAQLQLARRRGVGFSAMEMPHSAGSVREVAALERELERTVRELERAATQQLLPVLLDEMCAVLAGHAEHLSLEPCSLTLDSMNFIVPASAQAITPRVSVLKLAERGPFAVLIARFPRSELRSQDRLADAARYL